MKTKIKILLGTFAIACLLGNMANFTTIHASNNKDDSEQHIGCNDPCVFPFPFEGDDTEEELLSPKHDSTTVPVAQRGVGYARPAGSTIPEPFNFIQNGQSGRLRLYCENNPNTVYFGIHWTPLHYAVELEAVEMIRIIVDRCPLQKNEKDHYGHTPFDLAKEKLHLSQNPSIMELLKP